MSAQHCPNCGGFLALRVSHTQKNPNRGFYTCHEDGCNYFRWADTPKTRAADKTLAIHDAAKVLVRTVRTVRTEWKDDSPAGGANSSIVSLMNQKEQETKVEFVPPTGEGLSFLPPAPVIARPSAEFTPSHYQQDFYFAIQNSDDNLVLIAGPGSGKTTTIKHSAPYLPSGKDVVAVAFNRKNANELAEVMPGWIQCQTLHSLGLKSIRQQFGDIQIEDHKVYNLLRDYDNDKVKDNAPAINRLVSLCKNTLFEPTPENLDHLSNYYGVDLNGDTPFLYGITSQVFKASAQQTQIIDFDDMIYFPGSGKVPSTKHDFFLIDETQDLNAAQIQMVLRSLSPNGRVTAVGDPKQSLYGFRAADVDAVEKVTQALNARTLPLSISYRLPLSHVRQLNELFHDVKIEARDGAPEGLIADLPPANLFQKVSAGNMVVCRTNAPLIEPCFELIRRGIKATIAGRDIGKNLINLLRKMQKRADNSDLRQVLYAMQDYVSREVPKLVAAHKDGQALSLQDSCETLIALSDGCYSLSQLETKINSVFSDDVKGVVFSSIHRCKGLEADKVFLLHRELIPHPMARQDWQRQQESNCLFVALSRSKNELYYVR